MEGSLYHPGTTTGTSTTRLQKMNGATPFQARPELYGAFSVVDDTKNKTQKIANEATKGFEKASAKAQASAGGIELYSGKFYAACTIGGMLACVSASLYNESPKDELSKAEEKALHVRCRIPLC